MAVSDITRSSVLDAIAEYDRSGAESFLAKYGFGSARSYVLEYGGHRYDSKAIVGAAHGYATGRPLRARDFSGGAVTVQRRLESLGFDVIRMAADARSRERRSGVAHGVTAELLGAALREWDQLGRDAFLARYGGNPADRYVVVTASGQADALALLLGARALAGMDTTGPWRGDQANVADPLVALGFQVEDGRNRSAGPPSTEAWGMPPGTITTRADVAAMYGGSTQGGIQPSTRTPNIMIYSDPESGRTHGYRFDGFANDGAYYYTGEGQVGDQQIRAGNRALLDHRKKNRTVRLFEAAGGKRKGGKPQRYLGAFAVDPNDPYRVEQAADRNGLDRGVVVFRLLPTEAVTSGDTLQPMTEAPPRPTVVEIVDSERNVNQSFQVASTDSREGRRWESHLMFQLEDFLSSIGHEVRRIAIQPEGESDRLLTDTYDVTTNELFEIKPTASRAHIRSAVAQLLDYRRHVNNLNAATVLVPTVPSHDLRDYIAAVGLGLAVLHNKELIRL